jgi:hypothetical protein
MHTDWEGLAFTAGFIAVAVVGTWWITRLCLRDIEAFERRFSDPQAGPAGTGVERASPDADTRALPRSPQTSAGAEDPRPSAPAGPKLPAGVVGTALRATPTGVHRRRVIAG